MTKSQERLSSVRGKFLGAFLVYLLGVEERAALAGAPRYFRTSELPFSGDVSKPKNIFLLFDGTQNDDGSDTNVHKLYRMLVANGADSQRAAIYIPGVGKDLAVVTGTVLGRRMETRILLAYEFLTRLFRPGDHIYIFGFSRGAHTARALAGIVSYAGVPTFAAEEWNRVDKGARIVQQELNSIVDLVKVEKDDEHASTWMSWTPGQPPPMQERVREKLGRHVQYADIEFVGVWDTVPGSSFKDYGDCREQHGIFKRYFHWLPLIDRGDRYKSGSYPTIRRLSQALARDEKRSKFHPLRLCPAYNTSYTSVVERAFPGAHSDVGGGYSPASTLPGLSMNWILDQLVLQYDGFGKAIPHVSADPLDFAHWSILDPPGNLGSHCRDRQIDPAIEDESIRIRQTAGQAPLVVKKQCTLRPYPISCTDTRNGEVVGAAPALSSCTVLSAVPRAEASPPKSP